MSDLTPWMGNKIVRWLAGEAMPSPPSGLFVGIFNGNPKTVGVEVTEDIRYEGRLAMAVVAPALGEANQIDSTTDLDFGVAEIEFTMTHLAVFDDGGAGNMIASKAIPGGPYIVAVGTRVEFLAGDLSFIVGSAT